MRRILIALDGSPEGEQILQEVARVGSADTALDLIHVLPASSRGVPDLGLDAEDVAAEYLDRVARGIRGRKVRTCLWRGEPQEELPKAARSLDADLLALTTHARRGLARLLMGSVAEAVVRSAPVPVLMTRPGLARPVKPLERLLVPCDGSASSLEVLSTVRELAGESGAEVVLLQVIGIPAVVPPELAFVPPPEPDPAHALDELASRLAREGLRARTMVTRGSPARQILEQARAIDADLIVMTTAGRKGLSRLLLGSVSESVVRRMDRAVVLHRVLPRTEAAARAGELHAQGAD